MLGFHIWSIAKYEMITLTRSWFFRIFGVIALVVLFFYNLVTQAEVFGSGDWDISIIPAGVPYMNLLILNMAQAIIAAFLASDFLKRDKKLDTTEVIYMRSMTNFDYVLGKTLGNLIVFLALNIIVLIMAGIFNLVSSRTGFDILAYLQYLTYISIPTLVFILGLSFLIMSLIRNQGITFLLLIGYIALTVFYLKGKVYYLFDYMAYTVPMMKSELAGFGNINEIMVQRGMYLFLGLGFIFWTIILLKRLPQSKPASMSSLVLASILVVIGAYLGFTHVNNFKADQDLRAQIIELNNTYAAEKTASVSSHFIDLKHKGNKISVISELTIQNNTTTSLDRIILSLNPGLRITEITGQGGEIKFTREQHILFLELNQALDPNSAIDLTIHYEGTINEAICYLDMDIEYRQENSKYYRNRFAFISPEFVMLTPETNWYPKSGVGYSNTDPSWLHQDFTSFTLEVSSNSDLMAISQGKMEDQEGGTRFVPEHPLPNLSLVMGNYEKRTLEADSIEFGLVFHPNHNYFEEALPEIKDTLSDIIAERIQDYERRINLDYPYSRFTIVEVPVQFASFQHIWSGGFESVQPELVFFTEMGTGVWETNFASTIERMERNASRGRGQAFTGKEAEVRAFNNFANLFTNEQGRPNFQFNRGQTQVEERGNPYYIFSNFYNNAYYLTADELPILNRVLESYLKSTFEDMRMSFMRQFSGVSEDEQANMALQENSFAELLGDTEQVKIIDNVIKLKGDFLFSNIKVSAGTEEFEEFLYGFLEEHQYQVIPFEEFAMEIDQRFDIDIKTFIDDWFHSKSLPGFIFSSMSAVNVKAEDMMQTMVEFRVSNLEPVPGIVKVSFRAGGGGRGGGGFGGPDGDDSIDKLIYMEGNQTKKISYLLDIVPRAATINTLTSRNIPMEIMNNFRQIEEDTRKVPFEGEVPLDEAVNLIQPNEFLVDNEDPEFSFEQPESEGFFAKLLSRGEVEEQKYQGFRTWRAPTNWTLTTNSRFYGKYVRSAYYTRQGTGDRIAKWSVPIDGSGYYEVYFYMESQQMRGFEGGRGGDRGERDAGKYQFIIHHDDGSESLTLDLNEIAGGWNSLGSYYFSDNTAIIELSNFGEGQNVIADAVKLVKQNEQ